MNEIAFTEDFAKDVKGILKENLECITVFGSATTGTRKYGSDIDMVVYAKDRLSLEERRKVYDIYWQLNDKYDMGLELAPVMHPIIFFADDQIKRFLLDRLVGGDIPFLNYKQRKIIKRICPTEKTVKPFAHMF